MPTTGDRSEGRVGRGRHQGGDTEIKNIVLLALLVLGFPMIAVA
jgi:hypothetical protein